MIDRTLNYGRWQMERFLAEAGPLNRVLDLGAGLGYDLAAARRLYPGCRLTGVESQPGSQRVLRSQGVRVIDRDLEKDRLPIRDGEMDAVILNQVLEHTKEVFWIAHEASRVLRVGGSLLVGVPNLASLHNRILLALGRQPTSIQTLSAHVRGYTQRDFLDFLAGVFPGGYRLAGFAGSNFYPFPAFLAQPLAALLPGMAWGLFFRFVKARPYRGECLDYLETHPLETVFYRGPKKSRRSGGKR